MSEIIAKLGLDDSKFQLGLTRANSSFGRFREVLKTGKIGGPLSTLLGAGGIIQGFRATINAAQEARDRAEELNRKVDDGTAAVARYGDAWDRIKRTVAETAISGLGFFVRSGESIGEVVNDQVASRFRGMTPEQAKRTREISETASANADRLSSPQAMAAARARGQARVAADEQKMREVARLMNDGAERREESALREKPLAEQITILEQRRNALLREYNDGRRTVLERAKAFAEAAKTEEKIAERRRDLEKETAAEQERQARARQTQLEQEQRALEKRIAAEQRVRDAREGVDAARGDLSQAKRDALAFGVGDAAAGLRGNASDRLKARAIQRDESRARRLFDSGATVTEFDAATQRNVQRGAEFFQNRALSMRENFKKLDSSEQKPFGTLEKRIEEANKHLSAMEKALTVTKTNSGGSK